MKGTDGKMYDIDFFMTVQGSKLNIAETSVHKINGKPLYNWKQDGGVWKKVKVSVNCRASVSTPKPIETALRRCKRIT